MVVLSVSHKTKAPTQEWWGWFVFIETSVDEEVDVKGDRLVVGEEGAVAADLGELLQVPAEADHVAARRLASEIEQMPDRRNLTALDAFIVDLFPHTKRGVLKCTFEPDTEPRLGILARKELV